MPYVLLASLSLAYLVWRKFRPPEEGDNFPRVINGNFIPFDEGFDWPRVQHQNILPGLPPFQPERVIRPPPHGQAALRRPAQNVQVNRAVWAGPVATPVAARPPRPQETAEAARERRRVLATFQCPFEAEENACRRKNTGCAFAHQNGLTTAQNHLKDLPSYLCTYHLLNICTSATPHDCINGLHPNTLSDILNLTDFERSNRSQIRRFFGSDSDRQCYICQEVVLEKVLARKRRFAILESCSHVFCADCLKTWAEANYQLNYQLRSPDEVSCPVCRTISRRYIIRRRFTDKPQRKRALFAAAPQVRV